MRKRIVLVTGATSGIGLSIARLLAKNNFKLILCGRRKERLDREKVDLSTLTEVKTLCFDVRSSEAVKQAIDSLPEAWKEIDILINNAGNAHGLDPIHKGKIEDWDAMIDGNVKGLLYVTHQVLPGMIKRNAGHIINMSSIAGKEVYANGNVYAASKFAVDALTRGMRMDLNQHGIKVTSINPGMVETEFSLVRFKGDTERSASAYRGFTPLSADDIADIVLFIVTRPDHVVLADVTVFSKAQGSSTMINRS